MEILDKGLQAFPHHPDVLIQLGLLLIMTGNLEAGDELLSRALAIRPLDRRALQGRAEAQLRQGALSEAVGFFERALNQRSSDADTRHRLAFTSTRRAHASLFCRSCGWPSAWIPQISRP